MNLYAQYIKERENSEIIIHEHGFITYKVLQNGMYYLVDVFVEKEHRKSGAARSLVDAACEIARSAGQTQVLGSVCLDANGVTQSLAAILAGGFKYSSSNGNMLYFVKDL